MRVLFIVKFTEPTNQPNQPQKTHFETLAPKKEAKKEHKKNTIFKKLSKKVLFNLVK